jgi:TolB protein
MRLLASTVLTLLLVLTLLSGLPMKSENQLPSILKSVHAQSDENLATVPGSRSKIAFAQNGEIFVVNPDGRGLHQITFSNPGTFNYQPALSPDGTRVAYGVAEGGGQSGIVIMNSDGSGTPLRLTTTLFGFDGEPVWSPDATEIAFVRGYDATAAGIANSGSCGSEILRIGINNLAAGTQSVTQGGGGTDPSWSPNGVDIAYVSVRSGNYEIYKYNIPENKTDRLTFTPEHEAEPKFSPNGKQIVYGSGYFQTQTDCGFAHTGRNSEPIISSPDIYVMMEDGSNQTRLTETGNCYEPAWSPDGESLSFISFENGFTQLFILDNVHKGPYAITSDSGEKSSPSWSN